MTLVDTSVWIEHLRRGQRSLATLLGAGTVLCHPFVIGELACGHLANRAHILNLLTLLPQAPVAEHAEVLHIVQAHGLQGQGLGWIDMHLLTSSLVAGCGLWTFDGRMRAAARRIGVTVALLPADGREPGGERRCE